MIWVVISASILVALIWCLFRSIVKPPKKQELPRKEDTSDTDTRFFNPNNDVRIDFDSEEYSSGGVDFMAPECDDDAISPVHRRNLPNLKAPCLSFAARVLNHITERKLLPSDVYKRGEISRQNYSRIVAADDSKVNKLTAMQFCVGLKLSKADSDNLLRTAGYAFSDVLKEDKAFSYCIEHKLWSMDEVRKRM